ncbi:MAG TPA: 1-deoxy-D-xylulose-5-phosphate reductoisomerase [Dongiaceae bacterium]|jgi:1-deoxy-D-xylulose-5-phosphate reductoisomerase|nr:1-deoxy-D-xylulose-5-phosphate reductoisomerase [Dongiaceae bacterium]
MAMSAPQEKRRVTILGSTGSVGCNTLDVVRAHPDKYSVDVLTANNNCALLIEQARAVKPRMVVTAHDEHYQRLKEGLDGTGIEVAAGRAAIIAAAGRPTDIVMASIVGAAGLEPVLAAIRAGAMIGLANKETLVCAGEIVLGELARSNSVLLPVDSEHSAIFQVLAPHHRDSLERIVLTASGGPFRTKSVAEMRAMTREQALAHPNWSMGAKISIDSATMMNKGLELIEAHYLFNLPEERIDILVHPQSIIHSMVTYRDGSVLAQLGSPDMRTPIAVALAYPNRIETPAPRLDLAAIGKLTFEQPDPERFPALRLARQALRAAGSAPAILNAANEEAVTAFLNGEIVFTEIAAIVEEVLDVLPGGPAVTLEEVLAVDAEARRHARGIIGSR